MTSYILNGLIYAWNTLQWESRLLFLVATYMNVICNIESIAVMKNKTSGNKFSHKKKKKKKKPSVLKKVLSSDIRVT